AAGVAHDLQAEALPELTAIANELGMTCFLGVLDGEECITLASVEPRHAVASVAQRPGARHPVTVGAPGKAILSLLPEDEWPDVVPPTLAGDVESTRIRGYATSHDEVIPTVQAVAVPLALRGQRPAAIAVVHVSTDLDDAEIAARLQRAASDIRDALDG
ncbi:IclR family transcriptional regulator C-terminal domain-containing protein, partial [Microbacterium sp. H6]